MQQPFSTCPEHAQALRKHMPPALLKNAPRNAHTDIHTYKQPPTFWSYLTLGDAHTRVARSPQPSARNPRTASAARGLQAANHA